MSELAALRKIANLYVGCDAGHFNDREEGIVLILVKAGVLCIKNYQITLAE